jgi:hypothetical protein
MKYHSTLSSNVKRRIVRFSAKISTGFKRPAFKFVSQMLCGILIAQSCHLSDISRSLNEKSLLKKTIDRLSRNLNHFDEYEQLNNNYVEKIKSLVSDKTLLIVDGGDIAKPCSPKMEHIGKVRDGSTGEIVQGYLTLGITALTQGHKMPICVYNRVYSAVEEGFISEDYEVLKGLDFLSAHFKKNNIRIFDRGYDANIYYERLGRCGEAFVIRAKKNRSVICKGTKINILELAQRFKGKYSLKFKKKNGRDADCKISIVPICLPCLPNVKLNLVICNGIGKDPLMLITNLKSEDTRLPVVITKVYLLRWRIEEFYRFKKQQFGFEDFRVRSLASIRTLDLLVTIAIGWIGLMSDKCDESPVVLEILRISKRIYGIANFVFYAIADGLFALMAKCNNGIYFILRKKPKPLQLSFFSHSAFDCFP